MSILKAIEDSKRPPAKVVPADTQQTCIDLPGEAIRCVVHKPKLEVVLRKHRDVIFDIKLQEGAKYTVEADQSDFYNARDKQLVMHRKKQHATFKDGERLHLWVSRDFKGKLTLKADQQILGSYEPIALDNTRYAPDPSIKPEPMVVALHSAKTGTIGQCTLEDPFGTGTIQAANHSIMAPWLKDMPAHGSQFDYSQALASQQREEVQVQEYVVVAVAQEHELQPQVKAQLDAGQAVVDHPEKIFKPITAESVLTHAADSFLSTLQESAWKEAAGYAQEHWKQFTKLGMTVRIERKVKGKYVVAFTGKVLTKAVNSTAKQLAGYTLQKKVFKPPMGSHSTAPLDGGYGRTGKAGFGGAKRITLTTARNFKSGMKIQIIGTVVDLYGDFSNVFGSNGSRDMSEFLGRAGVSMLKAGATAAIGGALAAVFGGLLLTAGAPMLLVAGVVVLGYIAAATMLDIVDSSFEIKERVAAAAR